MKIGNIEFRVAIVNIIQHANMNINTYVYGLMGVYVMRIGICIRI